LKGQGPWRLGVEGAAPRSASTAFNFCRATGGDRRASGGNADLN
jgi:hypothetical protein